MKDYSSCPILLKLLTNMYTFVLIYDSRAYKEDTVTLMWFLQSREFVTDIENEALAKPLSKY